ncbi:hypothetical protein [Rubinisphaera brasiliensis]|uniref:hypothetical protein n=1 Tax=Rubinisphaera brasiliensis TaxID=119 RepID=UPI0012377D40|nr:hypothetical protein [Rubinisphaera brasiliensis]
MRSWCWRLSQPHVTFYWLYDHFQSFHQEHRVGAEPYDYTVPYEADIQAALDKLRQQVFASGNFRGAEFDPASPEEALEMTAEEGTASILDILRVSETPDFCCAAPLSAEELNRYFGTEKPTRNQIADSDDFWDDLERGMARYIILYDGEEPKQIYFVGFSFD